MPKTPQPMPPINELIGCAEGAQEDFDNLANVFSWLSRLFFEIGQKCKNKDDQSAVLSLFAIETMAEMGNYLAVSWGETAGCMGRNVQDAVGRLSTEHHDLQVTAQALATMSKAVSTASSARESAHA